MKKYSCFEEIVVLNTHSDKAVAIERCYCLSDDADQSRIFQGVVPVDMCQAISCFDYAVLLKVHTLYFWRDWLVPLDTHVCVRLAYIPNITALVLSLEMWPSWNESIGIETSFTEALLGVRDWLAPQRKCHLPIPDSFIGCTGFQWWRQVGAGVGAPVGKAVPPSGNFYSFVGASLGRYDNVCSPRRRLAAPTVYPFFCPQEDNFSNKNPKFSAPYARCRGTRVFSIVPFHMAR